MSSLRSALAALALPLALSGCSVAPPPTTEEVVAAALPETTSVRERWSEAADAGPVESGWLGTFQDPVLESLVAEAVRNNRELAGALANLEGAAAAARAAGALLVPDLAIAADAGRTGRETTTGATGAALNVSWELDVWGRLRAAVAAAEADYEASAADVEFARQSLAAQTAKSWFLAIEANQQVELARQVVELDRQIESYVRDRHELGRISGQDLHLARAEVANAQTRLEETELALSEAARSLELLLGRYPAAEIEVASELPTLPPPIPAGVPSEILERRPDLVAAERRVAAAFFRTESARAARLPRFALTAAGGRSSGELTEILGVGAGFWNVGANLLAPLDLGGELQAQVEIETAEQEAALAAYGQKALVAFREVESALAGEQSLGRQQELLEVATSEDRRALEVARDQFEVGRIPLLTALQLQERLVVEGIQLVRVRALRLARRVDLHLALGGGFEAPDPE